MVLASAASPIPRPGVRPAHIIDSLIEERAPKLAAAPMWPLIRPAFYGLPRLRQGAADGRRHRRDAGEDGAGVLLQAAVAPVEARFFERVPSAGALIVIANHPAGVADGMAVHDALKSVRPDAVFYANSDAHRVCPGFADVLIPVEWAIAKRTREGTRQTLVRTHEALEAGRALVIFPAGRIARRSSGRLEDPPWAPTAFSIARRHGAPILPIHLAGPPSRLFHLFDRVSAELRDITLFHELLNKRGGRFRLTAGPPIAPGVLPQDAAEAAARMKVYIERALAADPERALP